MEKKLVVITGASSGFGKGLALEFNKAGYPMLLLARRIELLEEMNLENTMCEKVDVTDKAAFEAAVRKAEAVYGKTDLIINNAGVMLLGNLENQDANEWKKMLDVNVLGVMNGMQIVMDDMKERQCGTIIKKAVGKFIFTQTYLQLIQFIIKKFLLKLYLHFSQVNV